MGVRVAATVLVVEDEPEILRLMKQVLSRDFAVHTAQSAEEALQILKTEPVHAIVSDHMLPVMTGVEFLRQAATLQPDAARVLVTASTRVDTAQEAINIARVRRFLTKPFRANELLATVGEAVHEVAVAKIKTELVRELKGRNDELSRAIATLEARDNDLSSRLEGWAFRDGVTGLYSHRYFQEALSAELARARVGRRDLALLMVDVDQFRAWNREYGFAEGDLLLRRLAAVFSTGEACSRYGSNRFAALLPGLAREAALGVAQKIRGTVESLGAGADVPGPVTVRVGVAMFPEDAADEPALIDAAEAALLEARQRGGNCVVGVPAAPR